MGRVLIWGFVTTAGFAAYATPVFAAEIWVDATAGGGGDGSMMNPYSDLQAGIDDAQPGDTVHAMPGTYGPIRTRIDGNAGARITVVSEERRQAIVQANGTALELAHDFHTFDGLVFDSTYGGGDGIDGGGSNAELFDVEVMHTSGDCIDLHDASEILIENSEIHHCIAEYDPENNADAHGVTGDSVFDLTIRDSEIYLLSGDAVQLSPGRDAWDNLWVEGTTMWSGVPEASINGWPAGQPIGENAFDSKVGGDLNGAGERPKATFVDVVAYGWRGAIGNQGAFNVKEEVDFLIDGATVYNCEIAGRLRGPAFVRWQNVVAYDLDVGLRLEDDLPSPAIYNSTFGGQIATVFTDAGGEPVGPTYQNLLFLADAVPAEAAGDASNLAAGPDVFEDADAHDYRLVMGSAPTDAGIDIADVTADRIGVPRPFGDAFDVGAFEWTDAPPGGETDGETSGATNPTSTDGDEAGDTEASGGPSGTGDSASGGPASAGSADDGQTASGSDTDSDSGGAGDDDTGCGCGVPRGAPGPMVLTALLLGLTVRRRRAWSRPRTS